MEATYQQGTQDALAGRARAKKAGREYDKGYTMIVLTRALGIVRMTVSWDDQTA